MTNSFYLSKVQNLEMTRVKIILGDQIQSYRGRNYDRLVDPT